MKVISLLILTLAFAVLFSVALGEISFSPATVWQAFIQPDAAPPHVVTILWDLRMPRAALAVLVGAALAVAGTVTQAIMRNPLADPGILGINSGAAFVVVLMIVGNVGGSVTLLPWFSFAGALVMSGAIYILAWREGTNSLRIILIGIGLGSLAGAGATFVSTLGDVASLQRTMVWLAGSLQDSRWIKSAVLGTWLILPFTAIFLMARDLDLIGLGDDVAQGLGQRVNLIRGVMILATAAVAGAAVSAAGLVGFVGLAAPHIARGLVGRKHARLLPTAALVGALLVVIADVIARRAFAPIQLPVGLMTALLGTPFFAWLFWKKRND